MAKISVQENEIAILTIWEQLNNADLKPEGFKKEAGLNSFTMSPIKNL